MFIQIKQKHFPDQTSERKGHVNRTIDTLGESEYKRVVNLMNKTTLKPRFVKIRAKGAPWIGFQNKIIPDLVVFDHWAKRLKSFNE